MDFNESSLVLDAQNAIMTANYHILEINKVLQKLQSLSNQKEEIEISEQDFTKRVNALNAHRDELIAILSFYNIDRLTLVDQIRIAESSQEKKSMEKRLRSMDDVIKDIKLDIAKASNEIMLLTHSESQNTRKQLLRTITQKQILLMKNLSEHINGHRAARKLLIDSYGISIKPINLSDCVDSLALGKIVLKTNRFYINRIINEERRLMGVPYSENGIGYLLEEC